MSLGIQCVGEMIGTFLLILLGNGVNFSVSHRKMFANQPGKWILVAIGWAIGIFVGAFVASAIGAPGHINPAVSIFASIDNEDAQLLTFIPMQFVGAFLAQMLLYVMNWQFIKLEALEKDGDKTATRGSSATNPAIDNNKSILNNCLYEFIGTAVLIMVIMFVVDPKFGANVQAGIFSPFSIMIISTTILGIASSIGSVTGFALNPARDLSPRFAYQLLRFTKIGKELVPANWKYSWIPVAMPLLAGTIIGLITLAW